MPFRITALVALLFAVALLVAAVEFALARADLDATAAFIAAASFAAGSAALARQAAMVPRSRKTASPEPARGPS